jgi:hypothetical protein
MSFPKAHGPRPVGSNGDICDIPIRNLSSLQINTSCSHLHPFSYGGTGLLRTLRTG